MFGKKIREARKANEAKAKAGIQKFNHLLNSAERLAGRAPIHLAAIELREDESVDYAAVGKYHGREACLLLTDQRIIICSQSGLTVANDVIEYADVDRVETGIELKGSWASFHYASTKASLEKSPHGDLAEVRDIVYARKAVSESAPVNSVGKVDTDQLSKLAELHESGVLTDDEFAAAKAKALGL